MRAIVSRLCSAARPSIRHWSPAVSHEVATGSRPVANAPTRRTMAASCGSEGMTATGPQECPNPMTSALNRPGFTGE
jgi:hypothetical protein